MRASRYVWIAAAIFLFSLFEQWFVGGEPVPPRRPSVDEPGPPLPPARPDAPEGTPLPEPSAADPTFAIEAGEQINSTGTAFAIADGLWMTARHVTYDCARLGILTGPRTGQRAERVFEHPSADVAIVRTERSGPTLAIRTEASELRMGQAGFHIGFPGGQPGDARSELMGRRNMRFVGTIEGVTPVLAWAEIERNPDTSTLGGISGGPALDEEGRVIGVTVASSLRRGRIFTAAPVAMAEAVRAARARLSGTPLGGLEPATLDAGSYTGQGRKLRDRLTVGQVVCQVE